MFVRKKKNPSGVESIQIIDKSQGNYRVLKTIGSSSDVLEVDSFYRQGKQWIALQRGDRYVCGSPDFPKTESMLYHK